MASIRSPEGHPSIYGTSILEGALLVYACMWFLQEVRRILVCMGTDTYFGCFGKPKTITKWRGWWPPPDPKREDSIMLLQEVTAQLRSITGCHIMTEEDIEDVVRTDLSRFEILVSPEGRLIRATYGP